VVAGIMEPSGGEINISRRHMLAISAAAGGLATAGVSAARAQAPVAKRIDEFDAALEKIISTSEPIKDIAFEGTSGERKRVEPPGALSEPDRLKPVPAGLSLLSRHSARASPMRRDHLGTALRYLSCRRQKTRASGQNLRIAERSGSAVRWAQ
jgi:hypothetical protein